MPIIGFCWIGLFGLLGTHLALAAGPGIPPISLPVPGATEVEVTMGANAATLDAAASATAAANNVAAAANNLASAIGPVASAGTALANSMSQIADALPKEEQIDAIIDIGNSTVGVLQSFNDLLTNLAEQNWSGRFDRFNGSFEVLADGVSALSDPSRMGGVAAVAGFAGTLASDLAASASGMFWVGVDSVREKLTHKKQNALDTQTVESVLGPSGAYAALQGRARSLTHLVVDAVALLKSTLALDEARKKDPAKGGTRETGELPIGEAREEIESKRRDSTLLEMQAKELAVSDPARAGECLLKKGSLDREIAEAEGRVAEAESLLKALDTMAPTEDSPRELAKKICTNLGQDSPRLSGSVFGDLYINLGDMQSLRIKVLAAQQGFIRDLAKRRARELRKEAKRNREALEDEREVRRNEKRQLNDRDNFWATKMQSWAEKESERLWRDSIKELARSYWATPDEQMRLVFECIRDVSMKQGFDANASQARECNTSVNVAWGTGEYQKRLSQLYASQAALQGRMRTFMDGQLAIMQKLSPKFEVDQAYLLSWMERFGRIASDQAVAEVQIREVAAVEREFAEICGKLDIPDWKYVIKGPLR